MSRLEMIKEYLIPYIVERIQEKIEAADRIQKDSLIPSVAALMHRALVRQEKQPQWKPSYIGLFHLMASLITESYEYELMIADRQMYLDEYQVIGHWCPHFFYQDVREEEYVKKYLENNLYLKKFLDRIFLHVYNNMACINT